MTDTIQFIETAQTTEAGGGDGGRGVGDDILWDIVDEANGSVDDDPGIGDDILWDIVDSITRTEGTGDTLTHEVGHWGGL